MNSGLGAALASGVLLVGGTGYHLQGGGGCRAPWGVSARCQSPASPSAHPTLPEEEQQLRAGGDSWKGDRGWGCPLRGCG